jgi:hypothetical protein
MTDKATLDRVQLVIGPDGQPTAALVDIATWRMILALWEEWEDQQVIQAYLKRRRAAQSPEELGSIPWDVGERALDAQEAALAGEESDRASLDRTGSP